jgi:hypothetical protein
VQPARTTGIDSIRAEIFTSTWMPASLFVASLPAGYCK